MGEKQGLGRGDKRRYWGGKEEDSGNEYNGSMGDQERANDTGTQRRSRGGVPRGGNRPGG